MEQTPIRRLVAKGADAEAGDRQAVLDVAKDVTDFFRSFDTLEECGGVWAVAAVSIVSRLPCLSRE